MPVLSLLGNIKQNGKNSMMQSMGGLGDLRLERINPQMIGQILSNPLCMNKINNMLQNPQVI